VVEVPDAVRRQALHPFSSLPFGPGRRRVVGHYTSALLHSLPMPQFVEPVPGLMPADVDAAIEEARAVVRDHGSNAIVWLAGPDHPWLAAALGRRGLRNEDSVGMESTETAMVLLESPGANVDGVQVSLVDSYEAFAAGIDVELTAFGAPDDHRAAVQARMRQRWDEQRRSEAARRWNASIDGQVVGTAAGTFGDGGLNLFGGATLPGARSHGVYRALVQARWDAAVDQGTPALTVQAGRMSGPILRRLGFIALAEMPTYLDDF
jgi:GNAT superfamily N-acetyltransferase